MPRDPRGGGRHRQSEADQPAGYTEQQGDETQRQQWGPDSGC
ncbi:MAG: hypothetical protein WAU52_05810 [Burkholderiales bacterium]